MAPISVVLMLALLAGNTAEAVDDCLHQAFGAASPASSGTPLIVNRHSGSVIAANFFNSAAISSPAGKTVSVCLTAPNNAGQRQMVFEMDVGMDNNYQIKAYPEFIIGTKFGNQWETSFRYYSNNGLPVAQQWPVQGDDNTPFANLEYLTTQKGLGLPVRVTNLPQITVRLDMDEENVVGAERDVMLESWFYDSAKNSAVVGPAVANTLNNIVGAGHPGYPALNNTLLEMMVHIGPLSPNDVSQAQNNPGESMLTVALLNSDVDNDGIDDALDIDSYPRGVDADSNGIEDSRFGPVQIGPYSYSIWYGTTYLAPLVLFSRETNAAGEAAMDLTSEGEIELDWSAFLDFTLNEMEAMLLANSVSWMDVDNNPFPAMRSTSALVSGLEFGIELQTNAAENLPYRAVVHKYEVLIDGQPSGMGIDQPLGDTDSDGFNNLVEFYADSDPLSSSSLPGKLQLPSGEWRLISLPLQAPVGNDTVQAVFSDDITGIYGSDWVLFDFDASANRYQALALDAVPQTGKGYWILQTSGSTVWIDMPVESTPVLTENAPVCTNFSGCYANSLISNSSTVQWNIVGNPFYTTPSLDTMRVLSATGRCADPEGCTLAQARANNVQADSFFGFNGQYFVVTADDEMLVWAGYWNPVLADAGTGGVSLMMRRN